MKDIYITVNLHNKIVITAERPCDLSITFHILFVPKMHWNGTKAGHTYKKAGKPLTDTVVNVWNNFIHVLRNCGWQNRKHFYVRHAIVNMFSRTAQWKRAGSNLKVRVSKLRFATILRTVIFPLSTILRDNWRFEKNLYFNPAVKG